MRRGVNSSIPAAKAEIPPFFGGPFQTGMIMALSKYGSLRLGQIEAALGRFVHNKSTHLAIRALQEYGLVTTWRRSRIYVVADLDQRHPCYEELRAFGTALYDHYIVLERAKPPFERYPPLNPEGPLETVPTLRIGLSTTWEYLHLLSETGWCYVKYLLRWCGGSHAVYGKEGQFEYLESLGVVKTKTHNGQTCMKLNDHWFAAKELKSLLLKMNEAMPQYRGMAEVYRRKLKAGQTSKGFAVRETRALNRQLSASQTQQKTDESNSLPR